MRHKTKVLANNDKLKRGMLPGDGLELVCSEREDGRLELCVSVEGQWKVRPEMKVTAERHLEMVTAYAMEGRPLLFDYDHACLFEGKTKAAGWGYNLRINEDKLIIDFEGTPEGKKAIQDGEYKYLSPVYQLQRQDKVTGKKINTWRLHSVALTNTPFIAELPEIKTNQDDVTGGNMDPEVLKELMKLFGVNSEAEVNAKLTEAKDLKANNVQLSKDYAAALVLLNTQTVDIAISNKKLLPAHRDYALKLINADKELYDSFLNTVSPSIPDLTKKEPVTPGADPAAVQVNSFKELLKDSKKAKELYATNREQFDLLFADYVRPEGSDMAVNTAAGFGQKLFVATVTDLEVAAKSAEREILDTVHDRSSEAKGSEESLDVPRFTPGDVVSMPATSETFINGSVEDMLVIPLDDEKGYPIIVGKAEQMETNIALRETRAKGGQIAHKKYRNGYLLKKIADAAPALNRLEFADDTGNEPTDADILNAATILDNAEAPNEDRFMVIGATLHACLAKNPNFISRDKMGDAAKTLPLNVIGMVRGFEVIKMPDNRMPLLNASTGATGTTGKACVLFYQKYALAYGAHTYELLGPQLDVTMPGEKYNLYRKQGAKGQNTEFIVTYREN